MPDTALVVMARYPEVGATKTRLARAIGVEEAVRLYRAFLTDLAQRFAGQPYDFHWAYTPNGVGYPAFMATLAPRLLVDVRARLSAHHRYQLRFAASQPGYRCDGKGSAR